MRIQFLSDVFGLLGTGQKVLGGGGGGWAGAFGNVVDKKHTTHPLPSAQK